MQEIKERLKLSLTTLAALLVSSGTLLLAACNTTEGAGKDIEASGEAIQDVAD